METYEGSFCGESMAEFLLFMAEKLSKEELGNFYCGAMVLLEGKEQVGTAWQQGQEPEGDN